MKKLFKNTGYFLTLLFAILIVLPSALLAQEKMSVEEWQAEMDRQQNRKTALTKEVDLLQADIDELNGIISSKQTYDDCVDEIFAMLSVTRADVDRFRRAVSELEAKIIREEGPKSNRQVDLDALKRNKISALPEFFKKVHTDLQGLLDAWKDEPVAVVHTVVKGDCLWCIARQDKYYGNGFAWPKIYQANRDQIKDPNLIFPGQNFKIPPLTPEERSQYDKMKKNYKAPPVQ